MTNMNNNAAANNTNNASFSELIGQAWNRVRAGYQEVNRERTRVQAEVNDDVETFKGGLVVIGQKLVEITGLQVFQNSINQILEAGFYAGNEGSLTAMATEVRAQIQYQIDKYNRRGNQESLARAMQLKEIIGDDGYPIEAQGLLGACISGLVWAGKRIAGLMKKWFGVNENAPLILKLLCKTVSTIFGFIKAGIHIVVTVAGSVLSYVIAGIIKVANWIVCTVLCMFHRAKAFVGEKLKKGGNADTMTEDDFTDEDYEDYSDFDDYQDGEENNQ